MITEENKTLEETIVDLMREQGLTLSFVESCTGGMIASRIVNVPGASDVFQCGFVTYSNEAKRKLVGVKKKTLAEKGAVSRKCAKQMAKGGRLASETDVCISVTGIAGPGGGTEEKPVGTVFIGCSMNDRTNVKECHFDGDRTQIREQTAVQALMFLRSCILDWLNEN